MIGLIAQKSGMEQLVLANGEIAGVTWLNVRPNIVVQIKTPPRDSYAAVQLGSGEAEKYNLPLKGHLKNLDAQVLREVQIDDPAKYNVGDQVDVSVFQVGDQVIVSGISKGKGFAGTIKRHKFSSGPETHGHDHHRQPGSIGAMGMPRVEPGRRMAGHMGAVKVTTKNLQVVSVDIKGQRLALRGSVPGGRKGWVLIKKHA